MATKQFQTALHLRSENPQNSTTFEPEAAPIFDSSALLKGAQQVLIRHQGEDYYLRLTRQGKLILTK